MLIPLSFSGDTLPVTTFNWAATNATLLIHEASMADDQEELALKKAHSTFGQAISVGKSCVLCSSLVANAHYI